TIYAADSLIERYLRDGGAPVCILGDKEEARHFTHLDHVRYFVTSSPDYPYVNYKAAHLIPFVLCDEDQLPEHERIFCPSLDPHCLWLRFDIFRQLNQNNVEAEISNFSEQLIARLSLKNGMPAVDATALTPL